MDFLSPKTLLMFLPAILIKTGNWLRNKDANTTGPDDAFGNVLIAFAPAVSAFETGNENAFKKSLKAVHETLGRYLES
ncbi:MAG TPA: hypothetical protein PLX39_15490 [Pyrinomonadaceae bacterium]|nr:hypothetical protein [Pyrinomonadaceae bacterium]